MESCFDHWPEIAARLTQAPSVFLAFDYDGVLAPIALRPEAAAMPMENRHLLMQLSKLKTAHVAIVSGRALEDVRRQVAIESLFYAGNHGAEIVINGIREEHIALKDYRPLLDQVRESLGSWIDRYPGLRIEDKEFGLGVHYRELPPDSLADFQQTFSAWSQTLPATLKITTAKMLFEVRPNVAWNKGDAVLRLWRVLAPKALPFYLGDDKTDEDGFLALKDKGISIYVGGGTESEADYFLPAATDVTQFLKRVHEDLARDSVRTG